MDPTLSAELDDVFDQAADIARQVDQPLSSAHVLLALFAVDSLAAGFLADQKVTVDDLLEHVRAFDVEPEEMLERIDLRGRRIARGARADTYNSLHFLAAVLRETDSQAHHLLSLSPIDVSTVRATIMGYATGSVPVPRRLRRQNGADSEAEADSDSAERTERSRHAQRSRTEREHAPSPIEFHPSLGLSDPEADAEPSGDASPDASETTSRPSGSRRSPPGTNTSVDLGPRPEPPSRSNRRSSGSRREDSRRTPGCDEAGSEPDPSPPDASPPADDAADNGAASSPTAPLDEPSDRSPSPHDGDASSEADDGRSEEALKDAKQTAAKLGDRLFEDSDVDAPGPAEDSAAETTRSDASAEDPDEPDEAHTGRLGDETTGPAAFESEGPYVWDSDIAEEFTLDSETYPHLTEFGRNLTHEAALGQIDPVIGRKDEILQLIDIVGKRRANNPMLVGEPGVGKTAIAEGLAREFVRMASEGNRRGQRVIVELELGRLLSGTHLRGSLSERLLGIKDEVAEADGEVIVFLDEVHAWLDAGGSDGGDASGELKTAMARGRFPCIGATTNEEFRTFVEGDPAFERRFQVVLVEEPDPKTAQRILQGVRPHYEQHHGVEYADGALEAAVRLSRRYIHDRRLPDKAISMLDLAGSRAARTGDAHIDRRAIAQVVAEAAGLPVDRLTRDDRTRFLNIGDALREQIVGQRHVIESIGEVVRRNYAGFRGNRPIGSLLFLGPTGVGKTETVKVLADFLFHDRDAVVQIDMSEYMKSHTVSRFVGAPPGYVGHDKGGQLTESIRQRPYQVVLLDEIEKAHSDVLNILLQLFEEGRLTDGKGREVDFSNTLVVMTSNLGAEVFEERLTQTTRRSIGFGADAEAGGDPELEVDGAEDEVLAEARQHFTPELWNRIDEKLVFEPLSRPEVAEIAELQLQDSIEQIGRETGIELSVGDGVVGHLIDNGGWDPKLGARPMRQTIQRLVESEVARVILEAELDRGDRIHVRCEGGRIDCVPTPAPTD